MSFTFTVRADTSNNMLITQISGFIPSIQEYEKWEHAFEQAWQKEFGNCPVKILSDQRGFRPAPPEVQERVMRYRMKKAPLLLACATVVDDSIAQMQLKRLSAQSGLKTRENFFTDIDEALTWLQAQS